MQTSCKVYIAIEAEHCKTMTSMTYNKQLTEKIKELLSPEFDVKKATLSYNTNNNVDSVNNLLFTMKKLHPETAQRFKTQFNQKIESPFRFMKKIALRLLVSEQKQIILP